MDIFVPCYCKGYSFCVLNVTVIEIKRINNAIMLTKRVNTFEVAVLRILVKRQQPLKLSTLVSGFPDDCEDNVLSAVSSLKLHGFVVLDDYQPNGDVSINRERRKEILQIVDSDIYSHELKQAPHRNEKSNNENNSIREKTSFPRIITRYQNSQGIRAMAISSLLIVGIISAIGISMPATSPDTDFVAYYQYAPHSKWSNAYGGSNDDDGDSNTTTPDPTASASFVNLRNCDQKSSQQQT
jgi:hypothetical protein